MKETFNINLGLVGVGRSEKGRDRYIHDLGVRTTHTELYIRPSPVLRLKMCKWRIKENTHLYRHTYKLCLDLSKGKVEVSMH